MIQKYIISYQNNIKNHHITNPNQQFSPYWCPHWNTMGISTPWNLMIQIRLFWITSDITWYTITILGLWCIICSCIIIYAYNCNNICNCKVTLSSEYFGRYCKIRLSSKQLKTYPWKLKMVYCKQKTIANEVRSTRPNLIPLLATRCLSCGVLDIWAWANWT